MPKKKQEEALPVEAPVTSTRKRVRIVQKKEDHVYQANSDGQGAHFDTEEQKTAARKAAPAIFAVDPATLTPPRKNRGRPSKAYLEAMEEYNRQLSLFQELKDNADLEVVSAEATPAELPAEDKAAPEVPETAEADHAAETAAEDAPEPATPAAEPAEESMQVVADDLILIHDIPSLEAERLKLQSTRTTDTTPAPEPSAHVGLERAQTGVRRPAAESAQLVSDSLAQLAEGVLQLEKDNSGFLRSADYNYLPSPDDIVVSAQIVRQYGLRTGDTVEGHIRLPRAGEKAYVMTSVTHVNGLEPRSVRDRAPFESLTPLFPDQKFQLCDGTADSMSCRIVDLIAPIGKGQRALIVAQPKTGKTLLMKDVANAIAHHHPDAHLIMLLIDERPEEVTDMARTVQAEVIASTFDEPASQHVSIANIVLEKAKRMVECGRDVVIFLDSITRLARAYNTVAPTSGKILSGGVEANALQKPKRFFGAARNIEGGGSLTIIATALIDTGSKMDEVIFEEFKGTGNMELQLERALANKRIFPAVNLTASSTRRDELLLDEMTQSRMWVFRNYIADMNPIEAMKFLRQRLENTRDNREFIISINS